jgi:hypothetical protein
MCASGLLSVSAIYSAATPVRPDQQSRGVSAVAFTQTVTVGGATLQIDFAEGALDLPKTEVVRRIQQAANAVAIYYGRFPVLRARILILPVAEKHGVLQGTTWGSVDDFPAFLRLRLGQSTTREELANDWIITHELVHTALASLPDDQHWLEEGIASYVEPIARVQDGELSAKSVWGDMMQGMPNGEPRPSDRGLNHTHTWGRTYWGGAMFCLVADVEIRRQTSNRKGLQDALRAIVAGGGTIDKDWPVDRVLGLGDQATGTHVLAEMYKKWSEVPVSIDLALLWQELGIRDEHGTITFDPTAPMASVRATISSPFSSK